MRLSEMAVLPLPENIDRELAKEFAHRIHAIPSDKPLLLLINCHGGDVFRGLDVAAALRSRDRAIGLVTGVAESIAVAIFASCHQRFSLPGGSIYFHSMSDSPEIRFLDLLNGEKVEAQIRGAIALQENYERIIAGCCQLEPKEVRELCLKEARLSAREALKIGLIQGIIDPELESLISPAV